MRLVLSIVFGVAVALAGCSGGNPENGAGGGGSGGDRGTGGVVATGGNGGFDGTGGVVGSGGVVGGFEHWPTGTPESQGMDSDALAQLVEEMAGTGLDSLVVVRNETLILDAYFYPYGENLPHDVASIQKTVTSTLAGIAIDRGIVSVDDTILPLFEDDYPYISGADGKSDITFEHLLTMSSGLSSCVGQSDGEAIQDMRAHHDWVGHVLSLPMTYAPGTNWNYCTPTIQVLNAALVKVTGSRLLDFAEEHLFGPLGFGDLQWWTDPTGIHGDALLLRPRDMARLGQLFLNAGAWGEERIVSSEWIERATSRNEVASHFGFLWWIAGDGFDAVGNGGQRIVVRPALDMVIVTTGGAGPGGLHTRVIDSVRSDAPLPANPTGIERLGAAMDAAGQPPSPMAPSLSPMSAVVSGRAYQMAPNRFGIECLSIAFDPDNPAEASVDATLNLGAVSGSATLPIGMDGVLRFGPVQVNGFFIGMSGYWPAADILALRYFQLGGSAHLAMEANFAADASSLELSIRDETGYTPTETFPGTQVSACP